jgi:hypothetical protein
MRRSSYLPWAFSGCVAKKTEPNRGNDKSLPGKRRIAGLNEIFLQLTDILSYLLAIHLVQMPI